MIQIQVSKTADSRSCSPSEVSRKQLKESTEQHISDVRKGLEYFTARLTQAGIQHDYDKLSKFDGFYQDFKSSFEDPQWLPTHYSNARHHLNREGGVPADVNLLDVLEAVADMVMAGMGRAGTVYPLELPDDLLQKALANTAELLKSNIEVIP